MHLNFSSIMRSQCRPIIVRQNSANKRCPNASPKSIHGLGKTILQETFYSRMPRCSLSAKWKLWLRIRISTRGPLRLHRQPGHQSGLLCGCNIRYSQRHFIRCLLHKLKAHRTRTVLCSEELREMSHCQLGGSLWDWQSRSQSTEQCCTCLVTAELSPLFQHYKQNVKLFFLIEILWNYKYNTIKKEKKKVWKKPAVFIIYSLLKKQGRTNISLINQFRRMDLIELIF